MTGIQLQQQPDSSDPPDSQQRQLYSILGLCSGLLHHSFGVGRFVRLASTLGHFPRR